jgi:hypothetical protein
MPLHIRTIGDRVIVEGLLETTRDTMVRAGLNPSAPHVDMPADLLRTLINHARNGTPPSPSTTARARAALSDGGDNLVLLNVGGERFAVERETLMSRFAYFRSRLGSSWAASSSAHDIGGVFVDRDPCAFASLLNGNAYDKEEVLFYGYEEPAPAPDELPVPPTAREMADANAKPYPSCDLETAWARIVKQLRYRLGDKSDGTVCVGMGNFDPTPHQGEIVRRLEELGYSVVRVYGHGTMFSLSF